MQKLNFSLWLWSFLSMASVIYSDHVGEREVTFHGQCTTWTDAFETCRKAGMSLLQINSEEEFYDITAVALQMRPMCANGFWLATTNLSWWLPGQHSRTLDSGYCVEMTYLWGSLRWNNIPCHKGRTFFCMK